MSSTVLGHVIGTVALLAMLFTLVPFISALGIVMTRTLVKQQLMSVASLVSYKVLEAYRLAERSNLGKMFFAVRLDIPAYVSSTGYYVELIKDDEGFKIRVVSEKNPNLYAEITLPISPESNLIFDTSDGTIQDSSMEIIKVSKLHSGSEMPVIWCLKSENFIKLGLGILKRY